MDPPTPTPPTPLWARLPLCILGGAEPPGGGRKKSVQKKSVKKGRQKKSSKKSVQKVVKKIGKKNRSKKVGHKISQKKNGQKSRQKNEEKKIGKKKRSENLPKKKNGQKSRGHDQRLVFGPGLRLSPNSHSAAQFACTVRIAASPGGRNCLNQPVYSSHCMLTRAHQQPLRCTLNSLCVVELGKRLNLGASPD